MKSSKYEKGITLVALVITIIILLILAGITLSLTIGQDGIIIRTQQAGKNYMDAELAEKKSLEDLEKQLEEYNKGLPENTKDTEEGTKVQIPEAWYYDTPVYVSTQDGSIVKKAVKTASVEAIATGNGETVPVPIGFYYVGGNLTSGVVISDNPDDQNKYKGQANVPSGVTVQNGKFVDEIKGNQFVFIPCSESEYHKYDEWNEQKQVPGTLCDGIWDPETPVAEKMQVAKYGGFYVGRFESGIAEGMDRNNANINAIPQSKPGRIPWTDLSWTNARTNAQNMYRSHNGVRSTMMTGSAFDTMLKIMVAKGAITEENTTNPTGWGNCSDTIVEYTGRSKKYEGAGFVMTKDYSDEVTTETTTSQVNGRGVIFTTGASEQCKRYNIYDIAGNIFEYTDEMTIYASNAIHINLRGNSGIHNTTNYTNNIASRYSQHYTTESTGTDLGFRVLLYIK